MAILRIVCVTGTVFLISGKTSEAFLRLVQFRSMLTNGRVGMEFLASGLRHPWFAFGFGHLGAGGWEDRIRQITAQCGTFHSTSKTEGFPAAGSPRSH
jgi:hypothetical protein